MIPKMISGMVITNKAKELSVKAPKKNPAAMAKTTKMMLPASSDFQTIKFTTKSSNHGKALGAFWITPLNPLPKPSAPDSMAKTMISSVKINKNQRVKFRQNKVIF